MTDWNPFKQIEKKRFPKKKPQTPPPPPTPTPEPSEAEDDFSLFRQAMTGVQPMDGVKGREVTPDTPAPPTNGSATAEDEEILARSQLMDFVAGKVEFDLEYTDEYVQAHVKGLDRGTVQKLKVGRYSPEAHLDLHGLNLEQAYAALVDFLREHYLRGSRCLLLIPGRGKNSPDGFGVLRERLQAWLTRDPFKRIVLAFCTALPKHGGAGALYVLLRKRKKDGKINWERWASPSGDLLD